MVRKLLLLFVILLVMAAWEELAAQCSMCQAVAESNVKTGENQVGQTLNTGILYLMALPYVLVLSVVLIFFRKPLAEKLKSFTKA